MTHRMLWVRDVHGGLVNLDRVQQIKVLHPEPAHPGIHTVAAIITGRVVPLSRWESHADALEAVDGLFRELVTTTEEVGL